MVQLPNLKSVVIVHFLWIWVYILLLAYNPWIWVYIFLIRIECFDGRLIDQTHKFSRRWVSSKQNWNSDCRRYNHRLVYHGGPNIKFSVVGNMVERLYIVFGVGLFFCNIPD